MRRVGRKKRSIVESLGVREESKPKLKRVKDKGRLQTNPKTKKARRKSMTKERTRKGGQRHLLVRSSNDAFDDLSLAQKFDLYEDGTGEDMQRLLSASRPKPKLK